MCVYTSTSASQEDGQWELLGGRDNVCFVPCTAYSGCSVCDGVEMNEYLGTASRSQVLVHVESPRLAPQSPSHSVPEEQGF